MKRFFLAVTITIFALTVASYAVEPGEALSDPALEDRAREISAELRCLVCQNQSIDDSNAGLAKDLRLLVRKRLLEGDSNEEVMTYVVSRYGDFVLLKPSFTMKNILLWATPLLILIIGGLLAGRQMRKNSKTRHDKNVMSSLSDEEKSKLDQFLKG